MKETTSQLTNKRVIDEINEKITNEIKYEVKKYNKCLSKVNDYDGNFRCSN